MKTRLLLNFLMSAVLVVLTAEYGGRGLGAVETLEKYFYDFRVQHFSQSARKQKEVVIVDIDRDSIRELGKWPWRRDVLRDLVESSFAKYHARLLAFTFSFPAADDGDIVALDEINDYLDDPETAESLRELREKFDYDTHFAKVLAKRPVVLGYEFDDTARIESALPKQVDFNYRRRQKETIPPELLADTTAPWLFLRGYSGNLAEFVEAAKAAGHINNSADGDGVVRRAPLVVKNSGGYYESLPLAIARRYDNPREPLVILLDDVEAGVSGEIAVGSHRAWVDADATMRLNYYGRGGRSEDFKDADVVFRYVPAVDIIKGRAPPEHLRDKILIVGFASDVHTTPVNPEMRRSELIATQVENILSGQSLQREAGVGWRETAVLAAAALVLSVLFVVAGPIVSFALIIAILFGAVYFNFQQWEENLQVYRLVPPLVVLTGLFLWASLVGFVFEWRSSRNLQNTFGQYVPQEVAKQIGSRRAINMEGESRTLSVLFTDIRDFTSISEGFTPHELTQLMNRMLTALTKCIHKFNGTVDKYIGDSVMAFWNAPLDDDKHARNAVLAAIEMQKTIENLSEQLEAEGHPPIKMGAGICTGLASVGNMGSTLRMAYTAMGDTVNVASRVEGLTKYYRAPILVTDSTRKSCGDEIIFRNVDAVRVKGREQPLVVHQALCDANLKPVELENSLKMFNKMRRAYVEGKFADAKMFCDELKSLDPGDGLAVVYGGRLEALLQSPPEHWDGITNFEVK